MAKWVERSKHKRSRVEEACARDFSNILSVHPAANGNLAIFRAGKGESNKEEKWQLGSVTPLPVQVCSLTATSLHRHWLKDNLYLT